MLEALRNSVNTIGAKILLGLLVVSFAVWGIADVFTTRAATVVATVGEEEVSAYEFRRALDLDLQSLGRQAGRVVSIAEARQLGRDQIVLAGISTRKALNAEAAAYGLSASPANVRDAIQSAPVFQGYTDGFDRATYEDALARQGLTPSDYEASVREDLAREAMLQVVGAGTAAPRALAETLYRHRNEQRILDYIVLTPEDVADPGEPTDEQLVAFHEENAARFSAPDYRKLSFAWLTPDSMAEGIEIGANDIEDAYAARLIEFTRPATRTVDQIVFDTEEEATEAKARIAEDFTFADLAAERDLSARDIALGTVTEGELPRDLSAPVFAMTEPGVSDPIRTAFGWTLANVRALELEEVTPLDEVRDRIRDDLARDEALGLINEESVAMDDEIAGGATMEQIADRTAARYGTAEAVDARGLGPDGEPVENLPAIPGFLAAAFAAGEGEEPVLVEADGGGYYALSVDGITPAALRPLDEVREDVAAAWEADQRAEALDTLAGDLRARIEQGETLSKIAADRDAELRTTPPLRRSEEPRNLTAELITAMFRVDEGEAVTGRVGTETVIGTLKEVVAIGADAEASAIDSTAERYAQQLSTDVVQSFSRNAVERHPLNVYPRAIDATLAEIGTQY